MTVAMYVDDVAPTEWPIVLPVALPVVPDDVVSIRLRYTPPDMPTQEWILTPTATTDTTVSFLRVLEPGDLPVRSKDGYWFRAWVYGAGDELLFTSAEFRGPEIKEIHVTPPA